LTSSSEQKRDSGVAGGASTRQSRQLGLSNGGINTSNNANNYNRPTGLPLPSGQKPSIASTATKQPFGSAQKKGGFAGNSFGSGSTVQANGQMMNNGI